MNTTVPTWRKGKPRQRGSITPSHQLVNVDQEGNGEAGLHRVILAPNLGRRQRWVVWLDNVPLFPPTYLGKQVFWALIVVRQRTEIPLRQTVSFIPRNPNRVKEVEQPVAPRSAPGSSGSLSEGGLQGRIYCKREVWLGLVRIGQDPQAWWKQPGEDFEERAWKAFWRLWIFSIEELMHLSGISCSVRSSRPLEW